MTLRASYYYKTGLDIYEYKAKVLNIQQQLDDLEIGDPKSNAWEILFVQIMHLPDRFDSFRSKMHERYINNKTLVNAQSVMEYLEEFHKEFITKQLFTSNQCTPTAAVNATQQWKKFTQNTNGQGGSGHSGRGRFRGGAQGTGYPRPTPYQREYSNQSGGRGRGTGPPGNNLPNQSNNANTPCDWCGKLGQHTAQVCWEPKCKKCSTSTPKHVSINCPYGNGR